LPIEEAQRPQLLAWFQAMVATPLQDNFGNSFALSDLNKPQRLSEMEFHLPVPALLKPPTLMALLGTDTHLDFSPMTGFLKGFIDLIFVHNDRYYVADYKSNFLGFEVQDYFGKSLTKAMQEHLYDLQAWIYTLALDALLCVRLGENYQPERHLGGAYYFFLRGMHLGAQAPRFMYNGLEQAPGVFYMPPDLAKLLKWRVAFFDKEQAL
jgi:exodeoxyribonuclease V beta subunit